MQADCYLVERYKHAVFKFSLLIYLALFAFKKRLGSLNSNLEANMATNKTRAVSFMLDVIDFVGLHRQLNSLVSLEDK